MLALVDVAKKKGDAEMEKAFWNTYHCQSHIISHEGKLYGRYCKNRHCLLCCSIRKATLINKYLPVLQQWPAPHFVTLTAKSCKAPGLRKRFDDMLRGFKIITTKHRKAGKRIIGLRALECCFNPVRRTYNPHFHVLVPDAAIAKILTDEWLKLWTKKFAGSDAQDNRPLRGLEQDLIETIKYGAKIINEPSTDEKRQGKKDAVIYAAALYNIYKGMKGHRLIERFGFNAPKADYAVNPARVVTDYQEWLFMPEYFDWAGVDSEHMLSCFEPSPELKDLLGIV